MNPMAAETLTVYPCHPQSATMPPINANGTFNRISSAPAHAPPKASNSSTKISKHANRHDYAGAASWRAADSRTRRPRSLELPAGEFDVLFPRGPASPATMLPMSRSVYEDSDGDDTRRPSSRLMFMLPPITPMCATSCSGTRDPLGASIESLRNRSGFPSPTSAGDDSPLFGWFTGTTAQSDFSETCMSALWL